VLGEAKPTPEEIAAGEEESKKDNEDYTPLPAVKEPEATEIPEFWLTALRNHPGLSEIITDRDAEALKSLSDISVSYLPTSEAQLGFKLLFHFKPNGYFTNSLLEKTYLYQKEVGYFGDFAYDRALGTPIDWKEEKDLTKSFEIKKQRNKSKLST
jgi:nucleosome assembly protein 1-like 1